MKTINKRRIRMSRSITGPVIPYAALAAAVAMALLGLTYAVDPPDEDALRQFLVTTGVIAITTTVVFGLVVPRALDKGGSPRAALTLSILALILVAAYWSGLSPVLAVGGVILGQHSSDGSGTGLGRAAVAIGVVAVLADIAVLLADAAGG
jgi:hypothetical protein